MLPKQIVQSLHGSRAGSVRFRSKVCGARAMTARKSCAIGCQCNIRTASGDLSRSVSCEFVKKSQDNRIQCKHKRRSPYLPRMPANF